MRQRAGLALISALLAYVSFPNIILHEGIPGLAWIALVPFLAALDGADIRQRFALGFFWGLLTFCLLTRWMIGVNVGGYVLFALALSLSAIIFSLLCSGPFRSDTFRLFWWPTAWAAAEYLRTMVMGGFAWSFAYSQASFPEVIQGAALGGPWLVVWIIVLVNSAVYLAMKTRGQRWRFWAGAAVVFGVNWCAGAVFTGHTNGEHVRLALIQPNISKTEKVDADQYDTNVVRHMLLTKKASQNGMPDLVIWPETSFPDDILQDVKWRPRMEMVARNMGASFLMGSALLYKNHDINAALLLGSDGVWREAYQKVKLVPFTEYLPADPVSRKLADIFKIRPYNFLDGKVPGLMTLLPGERRFGVLICSEEAYTDMTRALALKGARFAVVLLNDGWFTDKEALVMHGQNAAFRAIESGISVARGSNSGRTAVFNRSGKLVGADYPPLQEAGWAVVDVPVETRVTFYRTFGDIFIWLCWAFVIMAPGCIFLVRKFFSPRK